MIKNQRSIGEEGGMTEWEDGSRTYWCQSKRHRLDGPAVEYADGGKEWWYQGEYVASNEEMLAKPCFLSSLSTVEEFETHHILINRDDDYIIIEDKIPSKEICPFTGQPLTFKKILHQNGIGYIPNLPGT
jgi:hypothetical protein